MKKKPELFKKTGKSSLIPRNFFNNLKENDLHYENKQITQCVFLGVLRLKPVPSIFNSNSVPSVSAPVTENTSETVQSYRKNNGNKKLKKNISRNNDISKVLNGKVSKKNPQQVKAAVRKVPVKKSNIIKIKLNPKKKIVKDKKPSSPSHDQETSVLASTSQSKSIASHSFLTTPTISLNSVISPTKFNPVQNLFDKLKQKIDASNGEPGTSKILKQKCKFKEMVDISETASKVCKMNANRQPKGASTKRYKNILQRNPGTQVRVAIPEKTPSPITISDSESTGKKSEDDITIVTDESNVSVYQSVLHKTNSKEVSMEDVIIVNDDPKPNTKSQRSKERVSEKNINETSLKTSDIIVINDEQGPTKTKCGSLLKPNEISARPANETSIRSHGPNQPCDIIVISDEPNIKQKNKSSVTNEKTEHNIAEIHKYNKQDISKSEVVIVGDAREVRVSPRLKKAEIMKERSIDKEQSKFSNKEVETVADEVIVITEDTLIPKESNFIGDVQQNLPSLYITNSAQNKINKEKTSQGLLKTVEGTTIEVGKQLPETSNNTSATVTNEKPKQRKNRLKSPLIPPELLTPMLLRSDLAPKKTNYAVAREKSKAIKPKEKSASRLLRSDIEQAAGKKQAVKLNDAGFIAHNQNKNETESHNESSINFRSDSIHPKNLSISPLSISDSSSSSTSEEIILVDEQRHMTESRGRFFNKLLKSSLIRQKNKETSPSQVNQNVEGHLEATEAVDSTDANISCQANLYQIKTMETSMSEILIEEKVVVGSNEQIKPVEKRATTRLLRSDLLHQKSPKTSTEESNNTEKPHSRLLPLEVNKTKERNIVTVKEEELNEKISPMLLRSDITKQESQANSTRSKECSSPSKNETRRSVNQSSKPIAGTHQIQTLGKVIEIEEIGGRGKALMNSKSLRKKKLIPSETQHTPSLGDKQSQTNYNEVIIIKEEPKYISPHSRNSHLLQEERGQDSSEENILIIEDNTVSMQKEKIIPRLLRSDINRQKSKINSPEKYKDTDLNEIVVISDNKVKEPKDKSNGKLSQSELSTQKIKKKPLLPSDAEKVVVLIHDEPKTKEKNSSTNSNAVIQEISQYEQSTDISNVQESNVKESTTKTNEKSSSRFLRSDATFKQDKIKYDIDEIETKIAVKTEIIEDRSLNRYVKSSTSCRLLRSSMNHQHNTYSDTNEERNVKQSPSTRSLRSRFSLQNPISASSQTEERTKFEKQNLRSPRLEKRNFPDILSIADIENIESKQLGSSSIPQSERGFQSERQNSTGKQSIYFESGSRTIDETEASSSRLPTTPKRKLQSLPKQQCKSSENLLITINDKFPKRKSKSLLMDFKQKTTMLLRSELAQLKTVDPYGKQQATTSLIKERRSTKVMPSPLANVNRSEQENVITNERKIPKRKSLIAELKKRQLAKEKGIEIHTLDNNQSIISRHVKTFEGTSKIENQDHNLNNDMPTENHVVEQISSKRKSRSQNKIFESDSVKKLIDNVCIYASVEENEHRAAKKGTLRQIKDSKKNKQTADSEKNEAMDNVTQKTDTARLLTKRSLSFNKKQKETEENKPLEKNCDSSVIVVPSKEENLKSENTISGRKRSSSSKQKLRKTAGNEEISLDPTSQDDAVAPFCENIKLEENEPTEHKQKSLPSKEKLKETNVGTIVIPDKASQDVNAVTLSSENAAIRLNKTKPHRQRSLSYKRKRKLKEAVGSEENATLNTLLQYNIDTSSSGGFKIQPSKNTSERESSSPKRKLKQIKRGEKIKSSEENNSALITTEEVIEPQESNATSEKSPENKGVMVIPQETKLQVDAKIHPKQRGRSPRRNLRGVKGNPKDKHVEEGSSQINTLPIREKITSQEISFTSKQKTNRNITKQTKPNKIAAKAPRQDSGTLISLCDTHKTVTPKRRKLSTKVKKEEIGIEEDIVSNKLGTTGNINVPSSSDMLKTEPEGVVLRQRSPTVKHTLKGNKDNPACEVPNQLDNKNVSLSEDISQSTLPVQKKLPLKRRSKQSNENKVKVPQENNSSMSSPEEVNLKLAAESPAKQKEKRMSNKRTLKAAEITKEQKIIEPSTNENTPGSNIVVSSPKEVKSVLNENKRKGNRRRTSAKRKSVTSKKTPEKLAPAENISEDTSLSNIKKIDTTVFDFDESEPEVVPLRLSNSPKKERGLKLILEKSKDCKQPEPGITPKLKKQKSMFKKTSADTSITKAETKTKLPLFGEKSPQSDIQLVFKKSTGELINSKTGTSLNSSKQADNTILLSSPLQDTAKIENNRSVLSEKIASPTKSSTSPLKQATITDMFNRVLANREKAAVAASVFGPPNLPEKSTTVKSTDNIITDMPPPRAGKMMPPPPPPPPPPLKPEETEYYDDDDSDCDSRMEWIPEEYAEYKFKYSAKKMMSYKPIHKCKICLLILPSYYKLCKHKKEHAKKENPYDCTQCDQSFSSIENLTAHLRIHKGKHPYTCTKCDVGFWSKKALDAHTPIHVLKKIKQPNKRFRCDICLKEFSKLCDMERHTRVHTGEKPVVCNICNKGFQQSHNLSKHLLIHLHVKPYHCEICNKQFGRNDVLNRHLLTHSVDKPLKCPHCPKSFIRQLQLTNHVKKYHSGSGNAKVEEESKAVETN